MVEFGTEAGELGAGEQPPVAGLLGPQVAQQALFVVGLRVALHRALVQAQVVGNRRNRAPFVEQQQHPHGHIARLAPASALRLPQQLPL